jgi:hypothetical protein
VQDDVLGAWPVGANAELSHRADDELRQPGSQQRQQTRGVTYEVARELA